MEYKDIWVLNAQTRNPDRPSLKYSSGGSGPLWKKNEAFCLPTTGGSGQYIIQEVKEQNMEFKVLLQKSHEWRTHGRLRVYQTIAPSIRAEMGDNLPIVLVTPRSTSTPRQFTNTSSEEQTMETQPKLIPEDSQTLTCLLEDFLARHSALQVIEGGSMTLEELSFLRSHGFSKTKDPDILYSKTLKAYYLTTIEKLSSTSLKFSPTLGIESNGRYLIAKTSEFPRTGKECSLSDILEENADAKYFLSDQAVEKLTGRMHKGTTLHTQSPTATSTEEAT